MKKILRNTMFVLLGLSLIFIFILVLLIIFYKEPKDNKMDDLIDFGNTTYNFKGKSENFSFDIGKVFFDNFEKKIYIDNFSQTKKIDGLSKEMIKVYFNEKEWYSFENVDNLNVLGKQIQAFRFYEAGEICSSDSGYQCEITAFDESNEENFKDIIKMEINYCTIDNKCFDETFNLEYYD